MFLWVISILVNGFEFGNMSQSHLLSRLVGKFQSLSSKEHFSSRLALIPIDIHSWIRQFRHGKRYNPSTIKLSDLLFDHSPNVHTSPTPTFNKRSHFHIPIALSVFSSRVRVYTYPEAELQIFSWFRTCRVF